MKLSTRSRYGFRLMLQLAEKYGKGEPVSLKYVAKEEEISEKYLSQIVILLKLNGLVTAFRGAYGGYKLSRDPSHITVREVVEVFEGNLMPVDCAIDRSICKRSYNCSAARVWKELGDTIVKTLDAITLKDVISKKGKKCNGKS